MGAEKAGVNCGNYNELHKDWEAVGAPGRFHEWNPDQHHYPELLRLRDLFRDASPATVRFWKLCEATWDNASKGGKVKFGQNNVLAMVRDGRHNRMVLPSGRSIWYRNAATHMDKNRPDRVTGRTFMGKSQGVGHTRTDVYGGSLTNNATQGASRDVMFDLIMQLEKLGNAGWPGRSVIHVHDEVVVEVPEKHADQVLADTLGIMATPPLWLPNLAIKGAGKIMERYGK